MPIDNDAPVPPPPPLADPNTPKQQQEGDNGEKKNVVSRFLSKSLQSGTQSAVGVYKGTMGAAKAVRAATIGIARKKKSSHFRAPAKNLEFTPIDDAEIGLITQNSSTYDASLTPIVVIGIHGWRYGDSTSPRKSDKFTKLAEKELSRIFPSVPIVRILTASDGNVQERALIAYAQVAGDPFYREVLKTTSTIVIVAHSQGAVVSVFLLDLLWKSGLLRPDVSLNLLSLAGVFHGTFRNFYGLGKVLRVKEATKELKCLQKPSFPISAALRRKLTVLLTETSLKIFAVYSWGDPVVSLASSLLEQLGGNTKGRIYRSVYIRDEYAEAASQSKWFPYMMKAIMLRNNGEDVSLMHFPSNFNVADPDNPKFYSQSMVSNLKDKAHCTIHSVSSIYSTGLQWLLCDGPSFLPEAATNGSESSPLTWMSPSDWKHSLNNSRLFPALFASIQDKFELIEIWSLAYLPCFSDSAHVLRWELTEKFMEANPTVMVLTEADPSCGSECSEGSSSDGASSSIPANCEEVPSIVCGATSTSEGSQSDDEADEADEAACVDDSPHTCPSKVIEQTNDIDILNGDWILDFEEGETNGPREDGTAIQPQVPQLQGLDAGDVPLSSPSDSTFADFVLVEHVEVPLPRPQEKRLFQWLCEFGFNSSVLQTCERQAISILQDNSIPDSCSWPLRALQLDKTSVTLLLVCEHSPRARILAMQQKQVELFGSLEKLDIVRAGTLRIAVMFDRLFVQDLAKRHGNVKKEKHRRAPYAASEVMQAPQDLSPRSSM